MGKRNTYCIIGRYMMGKEVTGYQLSVNGEQSTRFDRETVCFLAGKGQIDNCEGQIYNGKVLLRGVGVTLDSLPVISDKDGTLSRTDNIGRVHKNTAPEQALEQWMIVGSITKGPSVAGYVVKNAGGVEKRLDRATVITLASEGKIGNATVQKYNGKDLLRGAKGYDLSKLPTIPLDKEQNDRSANVPSTSNNPNKTNTQNTNVRAETKRAETKRAEAKEVDIKAQLEKKKRFLTEIGVAIQNEKPLTLGQLNNILEPIAGVFSATEFSKILKAFMNDGTYDKLKFPTVTTTLAALIASFANDPESASMLTSAIRSAADIISAYPIKKQLGESESMIVPTLIMCYIADILIANGIDTN